MDGIEQLADTIKKEGFSGSIEVIALGNGKYQIYSGHRRYRAVRSLGYPTIPCTIEEKPSETLLMRKLLSSNIQTRKMLPLDYARAIAEYEKILKAEGFKGDKRAEIARFFNTSGGQIYRYMAISKMIPRLQVMTNEPEFPYTAFLDANKFNKSQQELLADKIDYYREQHPELGIPRVVIQQFCKEIEQETDREQKLKENIKKGAEKTVDKVAADNKEEFLNVGFMSAVSSEEPEKKEEKLPSEIKRERIAESRQSIDFEVIRTARTLSLNTSKDFTISNKESVEQAIREIESALEVLKDKIR